jgi:DegV family protein with EDD domain
LRVARAAKDRVKVLGVMDTIRYAYRTGRIPEMPARLGSMLSIKPIFSIAGGSVHILGFCRNRQRGLDRVIEIMKKDVGRKRIHVATGHVDAPEAGHQLEAQVRSQFKCVEEWLTGASPVIGYSTGPGMLAVAYYAQDEEGLLA